MGSLDLEVDEPLSIILVCQQLLVDIVILEALLPTSGGWSWFMEQSGDVTSLLVV